MRKRLMLLGMAGLATLACAPTGRPSSPAPSAAPSTDIYLYRLGSQPPAVVNITNRVGYDNQPSFDGVSVLYTSQRGGQTDIYRYTGGNRTQLTATAESEYSPAMTPDGQGISVVRVEADSTQRLWRFPADNGLPTVILQDVKPVGYYAWLDTTTLALFVLGAQPSLQIADVHTGTARVAARDIGRSLQRVPESRRVSVLLRGAGGWLLATVEPTPGPGEFRIDTLAVMPDSASYVTWRSPTEIYTAAGSRILRLRLPQREWTMVADLAAAGLHDISRLAISPDGATLALVADEH